jgi:hypothetical protein
MVVTPSAPSDDTYDLILIVSFKEPSAGASSLRAMCADDRRTRLDSSREPMTGGTEA